MTLRTEPWPAGTPCWADLRVPDLDAARRFYGAVLGWEVPEPDDERGGYAVACVDAAAVAGLGPRHEDDRTSWTLYFASDDLEDSLVAVEKAGGSVLLPPQDVASLGRRALAVDPSGGSFGLWQAGTMIGAALTNAPGGLCWEDLRSSDPACAHAFYGDVLGVTSTALDMAGPDYGTFARPGEDPLGGIGPLMGSDASHWLVYFAVADADAAAGTAEQAGGTVTTAPFDSPFGRMAGLVDPDGADFWVVQLPDDTA